MLIDWIEIGVTLVLGGIGFYFANNYARQTRTQLAEARRSAYAKLWEITGLAAPTRLDTAGVAGTLRPEERRRLYDQMTDWYYADGNGMLLDRTTRKMYLDAKHNLLCPDGETRPRDVFDRLPPATIAATTPDQRWGCVSIRQLSLLRSQLKSDLAIYGMPYTGALKQHERAFLEHCEIDLEPKWWKDAIARLGIELRPQPWTNAAREKVEPEDEERCGCRFAGVESSDAARLPIKSAG